MAVVRGKCNRPRSHCVGVMLALARAHRRRRTNVKSQSLYEANQPCAELQRRHSAWRPAMKCPGQGVPVVAIKSCPLGQIV